MLKEVWLPLLVVLPVEILVVLLPSIHIEGQRSIWVLLLRSSRGLLCALLWLGLLARIMARGRRELLGLFRALWNGVAGVVELRDDRGNARKSLDGVEPPGQVDKGADLLLGEHHPIYWDEGPENSEVRDSRSLSDKEGTSKEVVVDAREIVLDHFECPSMCFSIVAGDV